MALDKIYDTSNKYVFNCRLNESNVGISLFSGSMFPGHVTQKAWSPNVVQDNRLGTISQHHMSSQIVV